MFKRIISLTLTLSFLLQQTVFAYTANLNLSNYLNSGTSQIALDRYRPISLRYFSYQVQTNDFKILIDKGDSKEPSLHSRGAEGFKQEAAVLLDYFKIGLSLPNDKFWVNLRPDSENEIIDDELAKTDLGRVMLEADLKLKQDTSLFTSPQSPQGKEYWNKLYKKAGELFGTENITIPTLTRPWIVPGEIILRESNDKSSQGAYIYKANLKVMLEEDYLSRGGFEPAPTLGGSPTAPTSAFQDPRLKELNSYSTQLIRELILPRLTQKVNSSKDYANLRQVYFSLILARWFKESFHSQKTENRAQSTEKTDNYINLIDSNNLTNLTSKTPWDKTAYFNAYQKSFQEGEYNLSEPIYTPTGQVIRRYMSGGMLAMPTAQQIKNTFTVEGDPTSSAAEAKGKVIFDGKEILKAEYILAEDLESVMAGSLEQSIEALNRLMEEMTKVRYSNGRENQAVTSLLNTLSEQLIKIDKISADRQYEGALGILEEALRNLKKYEPSLNVNLFLRSEIIHTTIPALESTIKILRESHGSSSAMEASKKTEGSEIISAVKSLQDKLPDDGNEQLLKFAANVNPDGELEYPLKKNDRVMIGHVRGDRAWYLARGLQEKGFEKLLGYIKFNKDFEGISVLPEEAVGEISNTFFERISNLGYTSVRISEDEKKEHTGYNANGRNEQPFPGERRVVIKMQKSSKAYVDTPEMRMKEVADAVLTELDGNVDFMLTNFLSSDMMKHTGSFESAKKSNEITDRQLGRIKEKIDAINGEIIERIKDEINKYFSNAAEALYLSHLVNVDYSKFLSMVLGKNEHAYHAIKSLEQRIPLFVITADHGASEEGLKENSKESDTFHSANPVPYIIYDPLRKQKIPLKEGKTIRNNAATLLQLLGEKMPKEYNESLLPTDYQGSKRRIAFVVLDGWGINPDQNYPYDAIRLADTPNYDWFVKNASFAQVDARGEVIGLRKMLSYEEGQHHLRGLQAGQTDIGHIHLFSGREVKQPLWYMDQLIQGGLSNGVFDETKEEVKLLIGELNEVKEEGLKFHYITVGSEGGVHASLYHMYALMRLAKKVGLEKDQFVIHFAADGRDVPTRTAHLYLEDVHKRIEEIGIGVVSVVFGRDMLVRKEGAENITNRLIDVLSGENLKNDDVTLVKKASQGPTTTGSPLTVKEFTQELNNIPKKEESFADAFLRLIEMASRLSAREEISEDIQEKIYAAISRVSKEEAKYILREKESSARQARTIGSILTIIENGLSAYQVSDEIKLKLIKAIEEALTGHPDYSGHKQNVDDVITAINAGHIETGRIRGFIESEIMRYPSMKNVIDFEKGKIAKLLEENKRAGMFITSVRKAKKIISRQGNRAFIENSVSESLFEAVIWDMMIEKIRIDELEKILDTQLRSTNQYIAGDPNKLFYDNLKRAGNRKRQILSGAIDNLRHGRIKVSAEEQEYWDQFKSFLVQCLIEYYLKAAQEVVENKQETQETVDTAKQVIQYLLDPAIKNYFPAKLSIVADAWDKMKGASSAMMSEDQTLGQSAKKVVGGIDFRQMNMLIQPQGSFASSSLDFSLPLLSKAEIESFDLDMELTNIQKMASSGIAPSYQRLKEYLAVCFAKERTGKDIDNLKLCLLDIFEKEQFEAKETPDGYKEVLVIADTKGYVLRDSRLAGRGQNSYSLN